MSLRLTLGFGVLWGYSQENIRPCMVPDEGENLVVCTVDMVGNGRGNVGRSAVLGEVLFVV